MEIINHLKLSEKVIIGFHGQAIYNSEEKISKQLGNGKLLNQLIKNCSFSILEIMIF